MEADNNSHTLVQVHFRRSATIGMRMSFMSSSERVSGNLRVMFNPIVASHGSLVSSVD
jgi:hypothetical protein